MGIFDKIMFWKKDDDFDFDKLAEETMKKEESESPGSWGMEQASLGSQDRPLFPQDANEPQGMHQTNAQISSPSNGSAPYMQQTGSNSSGSGIVQGLGSNREIELINSKLDTIKAMLGSIDQRLGVLEQEKRELKKLW